MYRPFNIQTNRALGAMIALSVAVAAQSAFAAEPASPVVANRVTKATLTTRVLPSIRDRFRSADAVEVPDFQKHVMPLLGRLGCNGRACHGSFQGRGDFQLSLFGYDFGADHDALMAENTGRVDSDDPDESLILAKPSDADSHEGGKRFDKGEWQYRVLRNWIAKGAKFEKADVQTLRELRLEPAEIQFDAAGKEISIKAIAHWSDGTQEVVTPLCRFSSNDDSIATVDESGRIISGDTGDTHVVVSYDNAVVPVPVLRPLDNRSVQPGESIARGPNRTPIDQLIQVKLDKLGVISSDICTDQEFIRRASLDIAGLLPTSDEVRTFLADRSPGKRQALVERLLESPAYAAWWATRLSDWTGNSAEQLNNVLPVRNVSTKLWFTWLQKRLQDNVPYDEIIEGIVSAQSRDEGETYEEYCSEMTKICSGDLERYADRESMPLFWSRRNFQKPEDRAIGFAYTFLGVRIECAQCHKHPFDQWSKQDFDDFSSLFSPIKAGNSNQVSPESKKAHSEIMKELTNGKKLNGGELRRAIGAAARDGKVVPFGELWVSTRGVSPKQKLARAKLRKKGKKLPPLRVPTGKILGIDEELSLSEDPRPALMQWLRDESNPYFSKAIVNRVWNNYFGIGIVDPTDDMNLANPPSNAALLDHLASEFIAHDFDLKWLHREIVASDAYQRSAEINSTNVQDLLNFSHHIPRRRAAEVVFDMVALATGSTDKAKQMRDELTTMAIADGKARQRNNSDFALEVFGQSIRETNCDCDRSDAPSLLQSIYLRNDSEMYNRIADRNGWVAEACKELGVAGPRSSTDAKSKGAERAADAIRKQIVSRLRQFNTLPEVRRERSMERVETQFNKTSARLKPRYQVPALATLLENPGAWKKLERANPETIAVGKRDGAESTPRIDHVIEEAYLRTLSRFPDDEETQIAKAYISESKDPANGIEGLMWALVNTKEFIISH